MSNDEDVKYRAVVMSNSLSKSSNGTASVKIIFQTKFNLESPAIPVCKTLITDLWLTDACFERTMHTLTKTLGFKGNELTELNDDNLLLEGAQCVLVTSLDEYNGVKREKIKFINDVQKKMDENEAQELSRSLADKFAAYKAKSPTVNNPIKNKPEPVLPPPSTDNAPPISDDDLPF
jgi:hypothetical protein